MESVRIPQILHVFSCHSMPGEYGIEKVEAVVMTVKAGQVRSHTATMSELHDLNNAVILGDTR